MKRSIWIAAAVSGLALATPATAQRVWQNGRWVVLPQQGHASAARDDTRRWASAADGRWEAGHRAPGGWNAYRRLGRGATLPGYWRRSDFRIDDYLRFGLAAPPRGYAWIRYYDDAVLVDDSGRIWDSVGAFWGSAGAAGYGDSYAASQSYSSASVGAGYGPPRIEPVDPNVYYDAPTYGYDARRDDRAPAPYAGGYPPPPPPVQVQTYPAPCVQTCGPAYQGGTFYGGSAYQGAAYASSYGYAAGGGTTTVIITPAPVVTTTTVTEEVVQEEVVRTSYVRAAPRRVVRRAPVRYKKPVCCKCVCR
ncbi:RcnB family protein [Sphingomonas sp. CJ20]